LGIPNSWIELGGRVAGNGFKFRDYYSVYNEIVEPTFIEDGFDRARMYPLVEPTKNVLRSVVQNFVDSLE
jgi:hypothetical protein